MFVRIRRVSVHDDGGSDRKRQRVLLVETFLDHIVIPWPDHPPAEHHGLLGAERDGDERAVEGWVVDVRRDPLAGSVEVDGARVRALARRDAPAGDEGIDDGFEFGG